MKKKLIVLLICLAMVISMAGCAGKGEKNKPVPSPSENKPNNEELKNKDEPAEMGRYIEHELELPELEEGEKIISFLYNKKGEVEVYTKYKNKYYSYLLSKEGEWGKQEQSWLDSISELKKEGFAGNIQEGEDGHKYVLIKYYIDGNQKLALYKTEDEGKTGKKLNAPYLEAKEHSFIEGFGILADGSVVINHGNDIYLKIYSGTDGKEIGKVKFGSNSSEISPLSVYDNKIITVGENGKEVIIYDTKKSQIEKTLEYDFIKNSTVQFEMSDDGTIFAADAKGIHRIKSGGTLWETVIDGSLCSLGIPSFYTNGLFVENGKPEKYYISSENKMLSYVFDEAISTIPEKEITVYSLYENLTIRQAVSTYQKKNFDVRVNYIVAMGQGGGTEADYIRALNTELLAGNGADVLILDGLPVNSYIEKGVLTDISELINILIEDNALMKNIAKSYEKEDGVYQMPIRFMAPLIEGDKAEVGNLEDMVSYIKKNPELTFLKGFNNEKLIKSMLALNSNELMGSDGSFDKEKLVKFLENLSVVAKNIDSINFKEDPEMAERISEDPGRGIFGGIFNSDYSELIKKNCAFSYFLMGNVIDLFMPATIAEEFKYEYMTVNNMFLPVGSVGLNSASKEQKAASEFIEFLFSRDVQDSDELDGFPVNKESLNNCIKDSYKDISIGFGGSTLGAESPSEEERMKFLKMLGELNNPIEIDRTLEDMVVEPSLKYLSGTMTLKQASNEILSKVNTYLAE